MTDDYRWPIFFIGIGIAMAFLLASTLFEHLKGKREERAEERRDRRDDRMEERRRRRREERREKRPIPVARPIQADKPHEPPPAE